MKRWVWYVIAAVVFALAGGGVLYGVLTHKEPGFMEVCWVNGKAVYTGDCQPKRKLIWAKKDMPLAVYVDFDKDHETYRESVKAAVDMWNKEIGPVFKMTQDDDEATVVVQWGSVSGDSAGHTEHWGDEQKGPSTAKVTLVEASDVHAVFRFAAHELGHVLGLAHDDFGLMKPTQPGMTDELKFVLPSDSDKKLLRETYR